MYSPRTGSSDRTHPEPTFWSELACSLRGGRQDFTTERLNRAILLLAIPMVLEMVMESLFAVVNVLWVARLGRDAIAVVGLTESVMALIYAVAMGISFAATAIVARRIGEKNSERAAHAAGQVLILGCAVSAGLGLLLGYFAAEILMLMGATPEVIEMGTEFARWMLGGNLTVFMIFLINAIFRGAGDAVLAMRTLWLANALNLILAPCLIFGYGPVPELGVTGAAIATNVGRGVGLLYQLWHLLGAGNRIRLHPRHLRAVPDLLRSVVTMSANGVAQQLVMTSSWIALIKLLASFGSAALAGYTIAIRIVLFATMPVMGLANAGATLVGQNLGGLAPDRAEAAALKTTRISALLLGVVGIGFVIFARPLVTLFTADPEVIGHGVRALWIVSLAFPLYAAAICFAAAFNGAGDTWTPTRLNFYCCWCGQIPLAWLLAEVFGLRATGVFVAVPIAFSALAIWSAFLFKKGEWKAREV